MKLMIDPSHPYPEFAGMYSTPQFRALVSNIEHAHKTYNVAPPTLKVRGGIKLDGANGTLRLDLDTDLVYVMSKETYLTTDRDNMGFRSFITANEPVVMALMEKAKQLCQVWANLRGLKYDSIHVYGEWCGGSIVKSIALSKLPKHFVLFGIRLYDSTQDADHNRQGLLPPSLVEQLKDPTGTIKSIWDFPYKELTLPFGDPDALAQAVAQMETWTEEAATLCPYGKAHGIEGVGEGWVWTVDPEVLDASDPTLHYVSVRYMFKTKGSAHKTVKTKKLIEVRPEDFADLQAFVDLTVTEARVRQGLRLVMASADLPETATFPRERTKDVLDWVRADVMKEESDRLPAEYNVSKLNGLLSRKAALILKEQLLSD